MRETGRSSKPLRLDEEAYAFQLLPELLKENQDNNKDLNNE